MTHRGWYMATTVLAALAFWPTAGTAIAQTADPAEPADAAEPAEDASGAPPENRSGETEETPSEPMLLEADDLTVDETLELVILTGSVQLAREGRIVRADRVTYNSRTEVVTATGIVTIIEASGDTFFGDYAELEDGLAEGLVDQVGGLLVDDSRLVGRRGIRRGDGTTTMDQGIYSPCLPCADNPDRPLLWQLRASEVEHDSESMDIIFRNVFFDVFGIPVLYTPYFSTPDPRVRSRTGWLTPAFGSTSTLGQYIDLRYFIDIAPEQDLTLRARPTGERGILVGGEYRRRFEQGRIQIDASANQSELTDGAGEEFRGHIFADGRYDIDENWRIVGELNRTTDDTYLEDFDISDEDVLESRLQAEGFYGLNYHTAEMINFQDLRGNVEDEPIILPWLRSSLVSEPAEYLGGQLFADTEFLYLRRPGEGRRSPLDGTDTLRASADVGWRKTAYTPYGMVVDLELANRATFWASQDLFDPNGTTNGAGGDSQAFLTIPRLRASARYPFARHGETYTQVIEPIVAATIAPRYGRSDFDDIPRNDSIAPELDEISIFRPNRFPGIDRFDGGPRLTVGGRYSIDDGGSWSGSVLLAQSYRMDSTDLFDAESGLADATSDIVGRVDASTGQWLNLNYRFRLDRESFEPKRHELTASSRLGPVSLSGRYTFLQEAADSPQREELLLAGSAPIADGWSTRARYTIDLAADAVTDWSAGLRYTCECAVVDLAYRERPQIDDQSIMLQISLANLGDIGFDFGIADEDE